MLGESKIVEFYQNLPGFHSEKHVNPVKLYYDFYTDDIIGSLDLSTINTKLSSTVRIFLENIFEDLNKNRLDSFELGDSQHSTVIDEFARYYGYESLDHKELSIGKANTTEITVVSNTKINPGIEILEVPNEYESMITPIIAYIQKKENISQYTLNNFFTYLYSTENQIVSHVIAVDADQDIVGHGILFKSRWNEGVGILSMLHSNDETKVIQDGIFSQIINAALNKNIECIEVHVRDDVFDFEKVYTRYGFSFQQILKFTQQS